MIEKLQLLGFSTNEAKIYLILIQKGKLKASQIIKETGISSSKIYELLEKLEKKGYVQLIPEDVKYYIAKSFKLILKKIDEQKKSLNSLAKEMIKHEELLRKRDYENLIRITRGKNNFWNLIREDQPKNDRTFSYAIK